MTRGLPSAPATSASAELPIRRSASDARAHPQRSAPSSERAQQQLGLPSATHTRSERGGPDGREPAGLRVYLSTHGGPDERELAGVRAHAGLEPHGTPVAALGAAAGFGLPVGVMSSRYAPQPPLDARALRPVAPATAGAHAQPHAPAHRIAHSDPAAPNSARAVVAAAQGGSAAACRDAAGSYPKFKLGADGWVVQAGGGAECGRSRADGLGAATERSAPRAEAAMRNPPSSAAGGAAPPNITGIQCVCIACVRACVHACVTRQRRSLSAAEATLLPNCTGRTQRAGSVAAVPAPPSRSARACTLVALLRSARLFELQREKAELLQRLRIGSIDDAEARQVAPHCHRSRRGFFGAAAGRCARVTA